MQVAAHEVNLLGQARYFQRIRLAEKDLLKTLVLLDQQLENNILGHSKCQ